mmetsp:Transcript_89218/g.230276  ORF Transcript_89218/g.230276 Transcript_89218/m.230276 type:complete len:370 (+) Transcript_89218:1255-2364(+)
MGRRPVAHAAGRRHAVVRHLDLAGRQRPQFLDVFGQHLLQMPRAREDEPVHAAHGAGRREETEVSRQQPELPQRENEGVLPGSLLLQAVFAIDVLQFAEVSQQHVVNLPEDLGRCLEAKVILALALWDVEGQGREIRDVDAAAHGVVLGADVERRRRLGTASHRALWYARACHLVVLEGPLVDSPIFQGVPPVALLDVVGPVAVVPSAVRVAEGTRAVPHAVVPLTLVAVVHLLRRHGLATYVGQRLRLRGVPGVRAAALRAVVLPHARVLLEHAAVAPGHSAMAAHLAKAPLALIHVLAGPDLSAFAMLPAILPLPDVVGFADGVIRQAPHAVPLALAPLTLVLRGAVRRHKDALAVPLAIDDIALVP